jgi:hypothetical protein
MNRILKYVYAVLGFAWAALAFAASISPKDAVSNLEGWASFLGLSALARRLSSPAIDREVLISSGINLFLLLGTQTALHFWVTWDVKDERLKRGARQNFAIAAAFLSVVWMYRVFFPLHP